MDHLKEPIRKFICQAARVPIIGDDAELFGSGLVSSLFAAQLVLFLEDTFKMHVDDEDLEIANFRSINALAALVDRKLQKVKSR